MSVFDDENDFDQLNLYEFTNSFFSIDLLNTFRRTAKTNDEIIAGNCCKDMYIGKLQSSSFLTTSSWNDLTASSTTTAAINESARLRQESMKMKQILWNTAPQNSLEEFNSHNKAANGGANRMYSIPKHKQTYEDLRNIRVLPLSLPKRATNPFQLLNDTTRTITSATTPLTNKQQHQPKVTFQVKLPKLSEQRQTTVGTVAARSTPPTNNTAATTPPAVNDGNSTTTQHVPIIKKKNLILDLNIDHPQHYATVNGSNSILKARMEMRSTATATATSKLPSIYKTAQRSENSGANSTKMMAPVVFEDPRVKSVKTQLAKLPGVVVGNDEPNPSPRRSSTTIVAPLTPKEIKLQDRDSEILVHQPAAARRPPSASDKRTVLIYKRFNENENFSIKKPKKEKN